MDPTDTTELVIAAVKGVRLVPQLADTVFAHLAAMITDTEE